MFKGLVWSLFIATFSYSVMADEPVVPQEPALTRPSKITCQLVGEAKGLPKTVNIVKLDTDEPDSDISDTSFTGMSISANESPMEVFFSNECDNGYAFYFLKENLDSLARRQVSRITATLKGGSAGNEFPEESRSVTCRLTKEDKK